MDTHVSIDKTKSWRSPYFVAVGCDSNKTYRLDRKFKFTNQSIKDQPFTCGGQRVHWDTEVRGFAVVIGQGSRTFYFWRERMARIGGHGEWTSEQARKRARVLKAQCDEGRDPVQEKKDQKVEQLREKAMREARSVTLQDGFTAYMKRRPLRDSTRDQYKRAFARLASLHDRPVVEITSAMVSRLHDKLAKTAPHYADQVMALLGGILREIRETREGPDGRPILTLDPTKILRRRRQPPTRRSGYIKDADLPAYFKALDQLRKMRKPPIPWAALGCDLLEFLTFTGLRLTEATSLEWERVTLKGEQPQVLIDERKNRRPQVVPLTPPLVELLERRKKAAGPSPWVFPCVGWTLRDKPVFPAVGCKNLDAHLNDADVVKKIVCKRAKMPWFLNHDLRRTFIRAAYRTGAKEFEWKLLLGHQVDANVTTGYLVDVVAEELRPSMERISDFFQAKRAEGRMRRVLKFPTGA